MELVIKELQSLVHDTKQQIQTTKESLEREQACKADLLSENAHLQKQLELVSEEANNLQAEIVSLRKQAREPTPEMLEEKGQ